MKKLSALLLAIGMSFTGVAKAPTTNDYSDVVRLNPGASRHDAVPGQVIVKFKNRDTAGIVRTSKGRFASATNARVNAVMRKIGAAEVEPLMPLTGSTVARRNARGINGVEVKDTDLSGLYCVHFSAKQQTTEVIDALKTLPEVEFAEPNYIVYALGGQAPSNDNGNGNGNGNGSNNQPDPLVSQQWGLTATNINQLCTKPLLPNAKRPVIAIIDTGVDITHPDLADNIWTNPSEGNGSEGYDDDGNGFTDDIHGWDFINHTGRVRDNNGHGTHCAGIAAAVGGNGIGIIGANPDALIMPVAVMQSNGQGNTATIIKGVDYAAANGANIISMSIGGYAQSTALEQALGKAYQKSVIVAAAGNDGICITQHKCNHPSTGVPSFGQPCFPASYTFVLGVQATQNNGLLASFSNYDCDGPITSEYGEEKLYNYELKAPGVEIISTFPGGQYRSLQGTSMACPLVAGGISRLLSAKECISKEQLFGDLITASSGNIDFIKAYNISDADRKPSLQLVTYRLDDTVEGDGDGRPDAGETIDIYPTLRNTFGHARNIRYSISLVETEDPEIVTFITKTADVDFGTELSAYAKAIAVAPFRLKINPSCADGRIIRLVVSATCDNIGQSVEQEIEIKAENGVEIGGVIAKDMTLTSNKNYIVTIPLAIPRGVTLTIEPGTVLKFRNNSHISCSGNLIAKGEPNKRIVFTSDCMGRQKIQFDQSKKSILSYCVFKDYDWFTILGAESITMNNNEYSNIKSLGEWDVNGGMSYYDQLEINDSYSLLHNTSAYQLKISSFRKSNIVNMIPGAIPDRFLYCNVDYNKITANNIFSNSQEKDYSFSLLCNEPKQIIMDSPCYFGSTNLKKIKKSIYDIQNGFDFGDLDVSNSLLRPLHDAHGIVWKVVVDGYDSQDEFDKLPPLGVGRHKFEVYFNRRMNQSKTPFLAMGVRPPYTQISIAAENSWRTEVIEGDSIDIYTAYLDIKGRDGFDGLNRIYVNDAEDNEYFPIPRENNRFNVLVQAAGSMSHGFEAVAKVGCVELNWDSPEENFDDLLGYNLYRYTLVNNGTESAHKQINESLLTTESFTDYDVVPGTTYCYYYKVMTTSMTENSPSKIVAVTPKTAQKGDSNGSEAVDVADIITTLSYMTGGDPHPFVFDAADVNSDLAVNVLDVVGTINIITKPEAVPGLSVASTALWSMDKGVFALDAPVEIAGVQMNIKGCDADQIATLAPLNGFEIVKAPRSDGSVMLLAYSMNGGKIGIGLNKLIRLPESAEITNIVLSDAYGSNVEAVRGTSSVNDVIVPMHLTRVYPNPFVTDLNVEYSIIQPAESVTISVTDITGRNLASAKLSNEIGSHTWQWNGGNLAPGVYFVTLYIDGKVVKTERACKQ